MALLYSLLNGEPGPLPKRLKIDGVTRTDPSSFTAEELTRAGYTGPFQKPSFDPETQIVRWDGDRYSVLELSTEELEEVVLPRQKLLLIIEASEISLSGSVHQTCARQRLPTLAPTCWSPN